MCTFTHQRPDGCGANQELLVIAQCYKAQDVAGKWDHMEVVQPSSGKHILVLVPGDKHSTVQCKHTNEVGMQVQTVWEDKDPQGHLKPSASSRKV